MAESRGETMEQVMDQILEFFVENEDERMDWPINDQIKFYFKNYWVG